MTNAFSRYLGPYFGKATVADIDEVRGHVWSDSLGTASWDPSSDRYWNLLLEQYKMCVEMADRVSARRGLTNTFFLTINTAIFAAIGTAWKDHPHAAAGLLVFPLIVLIGQCLAWFWLVRSYRQLNSAKYVVIGVLEEKMPASPYWRAEWRALGEGKDPRKYWPLSHLEQFIPALFGLCYLGGFVTILLAH